MTEEEEEFFNNLSNTLKSVMITNPEINNRVEIYEKALILEKIMEQSVGKSPEYVGYKIPKTIEYTYHDKTY